MDLRLG
jgi:hypothetical protein